MKLRISELFYSIQGEGARAGSANIFIRVSGCKAKNACYALGVKCDTEFESGTEYTLDELYEKVKEFPCYSIIWTGGEPADRVTDEVAQYFKDKGYYQSIETSGLFPVSKIINYVCVSPKVAEHVIAKNFDRVNELRYVRHQGQSIPQPSIKADFMYISPHSDGFNLNPENIAHCIQLVMQHPAWKLSLQMHKIWSVL